ncbi:MAG: ABC transporter ATP-binding protein [Oscillospiraceae bacterium]
MIKLFKYAKNYAWQAIICPFLMIAEVVFELIIPFYAAKIIDIGIANGDKAYIIETGGKMLVFAGLSLICGTLAARLASVASMGLGAKVREAMFNNIQNFSFSNIDKFSTASLVTRMTTDVTSVQNTFQMMLRIFFRAPVTFIVALFLSFKINPQVSMVFIYVIPALIVAIAIFAPIALKRFKVMFEMFDGLNGSIQENLISIRVVKAFVRSDYEKKKFKTANDALMQASINAEKLMVSAQPMMMLVMYGTILAISYMSSKFIVGGSMEIGQFTTIITYVMQILMSIIMMTMILVSYIMSKASANRISEVINEVPDISDSDADENLKVSDGSVEFKNVCFKYSSLAKKDVVKDASFKINAGETVGIIGSTGSAKTTLVSLISRLYDVTSGEILVGGHNVHKYTLNELREKVSMVLQKNVLFSGTILENLRWGDKNATEQEVISACKLAEAHDFIMKFPNGYNTDLGQGGVNVSGGQKQRLCIARALLKKPKILILDDSTSAVDTFTDSKIREALKTDIPNTTKIIIAQRISSVSDADKIIVLDNGEINAVGTHDELLSTNEIYKEVYYSQQKGVVEEGGEA